MPRLCVFDGEKTHQVAIFLPRAWLDFNAWGDKQGSMLAEPIVIIDDDTDDHFIFDEVCSKMKLENELKFFNSAMSALEYLQTTSDRPFIIFCDINMPKMTGLQLRRTIDEDEALRKKSIPFIFLTTAASKPQISEAFDLTVQGFFIKESTFEQTEKVLRLILEYWKKCRHPNSIN